MHSFFYFFKFQLHLFLSFKYSFIKLVKWRLPHFPSSTLTLLSLVISVWKCHLLVPDNINIKTFLVKIKKNILQPGFFKRLVPNQTQWNSANYFLPMDINSILIHVYATQSSSTQKPAILHSLNSPKSTQ